MPRVIQYPELEEEFAVLFLRGLIKDPLLSRVFMDLVSKVTAESNDINAVDDLVCIMKEVRERKLYKDTGKVPQAQYSSFA
jgi:hypothetical protein